MALTNNVAKRQKIEECTSCMEPVLFNSDSLFKIASYLPADDLLNLALTCRRFGIDGDDSLSLIDETARRLVHDIATEEQRNALCYGDNWLCKYNYLQSLRVPLTFDELVGRHIEYVEGNKSRVTNINSRYDWSSAFSNNIMMAGKHYVSFQVCQTLPVHGLMLGVMRPGEAMQNASGSPLMPEFFHHFTQRKGSRQYNNTVNCCIYHSSDGSCFSSGWGEDRPREESWDGMERLSGSHEVGMLLDFDEGTLSVYKNGRRLGIIKRGLAGHYCWVVSMLNVQVTMKRGSVPPISVETL